MQLRVPTSYRATFEWLASIEEPTADAILSVIENTGTLSRRELVDDATKAAGSSRREVDLLVDATLGLVRTLQEGGVPLGDPDEVAQAIAGDPALESARVNRDALQQRVSRLLRARSVKRLAKAMDLQADHQNVYRVARMFSEIRPLFNEDLSVDHESVSLTHTLKLEYYNATLDVDNLYLALDSEDLLRLKYVVDREITKLRNLDKLLSDNKIERIALIQED
jgi:hypothetical protein